VLATGSIDGGTKVTINRVRFALDCPDFLICSGPGDSDLGPIVAYLGDSTITTTCPTAWSTGNAPDSTFAERGRVHGSHAIRYPRP